MSGVHTRSLRGRRIAVAILAAAVAVPAAVEMTSVTGTMGCGHCAYKVTPSCAAALQTDAGVVWILEGVEESSELFTERGDLGTVTVTGTRRAENGTHYLNVASYEVVGEAEGEATEG